MRILVVGDGKVGHSLAENLAREGHDVVIIDKSSQVLQKSIDMLDVMCIKGNGANIRTLMEANPKNVDVVIAATASDEINMLCSMLAKRLGAKYSIVRIRDPEYNDSLPLLQSELSIDMTINPERTTALEISRLLRYPFASNIESFAKGSVEMVGFRACKKDPILGIPLKRLMNRKHRAMQVLYCAIERENEVIIPNGDTVIQEDDHVYVAADMVSITAFFKYLGRNAFPVRSVMLLGGGRISYYLSKMIIPLGIAVTIVEIKQDKAEALSEALPDVNIICGDGTNRDLLEQEGLTKMDAFVALSDRDEENMIAGLYAAKLGVGKVIVKNARSGYQEVADMLKLDSVVSPKNITCDTILRYVRARSNSHGSSVEKIYRLLSGKAEALEFIARAGAAYIGVPLRSLKMRKDTLIAVIVRNGRVIVPFGDDHIEAGDDVIAIAKGSMIVDLQEIVQA